MTIRDFWVNGVLGSTACPEAWRVRGLRRLGHQLGQTSIYPGVQLLGSARVTVGDRTFINRGTVIDNSAEVTLGDDVLLAHQVLILTSTHDLAGDRRRAGTQRAEPVRIGDGCWLGARVTVLPGVSIGAGSVVAAGAVVTRDLPPNGLYAGVPATLVRSLMVASAE